MNTFSIEWHISEEEWSRVENALRLEPPGGMFDVDGLALYFMLLGRLQIRAYEQELFPTEQRISDWYAGSAESIADGEDSWGDPSPEYLIGVSISILDIAWQLNHIVKIDNFRSLPMGYQATLKEANGPTILGFQKLNREVCVSSPYAHLYIDVSESLFYSGVDQFLVSFMSSVQDRVPSLLAWMTFDELRPLVPDRGERVRFPRAPYESGGWYRSLHLPDDDDQELAQAGIRES